MVSKMAFSGSLTAKIIWDFWSELESQNLNSVSWNKQMGFKLGPDQKFDEILKIGNPENPIFNTLFDSSKKVNFSNFTSKHWIIEEFLNPNGVE